MEKRMFIKPVLYLLLFLFIFRCGDYAGVVDDTENEITLIGYVLDDKSAGVEGVIARLDSIGAYDITDKNGRYEVRVEEKTIQKMNINLSLFTDSLIISKDTTIVSTFEIKDEWKQTLPNVYIVQRSIDGKLITTDTVFKRIEAVIDIKNDSTDIPRTTELYFFPINYRYSGYLFFINDTAGLEYNIYVRVYNADSLLTGRSHVMQFNSSAGDIPIHDFNPYNAVPIPDAGDSFTVSINDTLKLFGSAIDSFDGTIKKWEWDIGNTGNFISTTPDSNVIARAPSTPTDKYPCVLKVIDNDGNLVLDTVFINVILDPPTATAKTSTPIVSVNDSIILKGTASDNYGHIVKWEWDVGNTGNFNTTTPDSNYISKAPSKPTSEYYCVLKVTDDDGNVAMDTVFINVIQAPPIAIAKTSTPIVSVNDSIILQGSANDDNGFIVNWEWDIGNTGNFNTTTPDSNYITKAPSEPTAEFSCVLRATDDDGNVAMDTVFINVILDPPMAIAKTSTPIVYINDSIILQGTASDKSGYIVEWEWDVGNTGNFNSTTPDSNYTTKAPSKSTAEYPCVLKVVDDDGNVAMDTVFIKVILAPPTATAKTSTPIVSVNDSISLQGTASDNNGYIVKWEWDVGSSGTFLETTPDSNLMVAAPSTENNDYQCILRVTDDDNISSLDTVSITVILDKPKSEASSTTPSVSINDTIKLLGTATDDFGHIVKWEWDVGNTGTFIETTPDSNLMVAAPSTDNNDYQCILRVTDDDSISSLDTVSIVVLLDKPKSEASSTTPSVSINDTIKLFGTATDGFGHIVKWEWDVGNTGTFIEITPDSNFMVVAPSTENNEYQCVLRVTDDDNISSLDTVIITVLFDKPKPEASTTTPSVSINDTIKLFGTATNDFGHIVKWEWDVGNTGTFIEITPDSNFMVVAPSTENNDYQCVLRVTDDDSISSLDTVIITILMDKPKPEASTSTPSLLINDTIKLMGNATDGFGHIVKWEWDVGNTGTFIETTPDSNISAILPEIPNYKYPCVLQVTDDDGMIGIDTVVINVLLTVTDIEGNVYKAIQIGNQIWTIENFRSTKYNDGTAIKNVKSKHEWGDLTTGAYCFYKNNEINKEKCGVLYNWYAVSSKNFVPNGWHVPTVAEWEELENYLIDNGYNYDGTTEKNKIAKSLATKVDWDTSSQVGDIGYDKSLNNRSGFTAFPTGYRRSNGKFDWRYGYTKWWTSTEKSSDKTKAYHISLKSDRYYSSITSRSKIEGKVIRLVKD